MQSWASSDDSRHAEEARPGAASGALATASATSSDGRGSSARSMSWALTCRRFDARGVDGLHLLA